ncbi:MAG: hypothetical protein QOF73_2494 [Thermomicrobiales bacterium]|nr:hypothetical protein [Thermomicrobiales bacterium]
MVIRLRLATFNVENLDDQPGQKPTLAERKALMQPQLRRIDADVLCLQEVHGQDDGTDRRLRALDDLLAGTQYVGFNRAFTTTSAGKVFRERNLVVLSRFPVIASEQLNQDLVPGPQYQRVTAIPPDTAARLVNWERPILHVELELPGSRRLHVVNVHLKSKNPVDLPGQQIQPPGANFSVWKSASGRAEASFISSMKRVGQALEVRRLVDNLFDAAPGALLAVCGDFNADIDEVPMQAIRGDVEDTENPALAVRVLVPCERSVPEPARYSLIHHGRGEMLDHILASRTLLAAYRDTEIHNELLHDESVAFAVDQKFPESDHAPVIATFQLSDA